MAHSSALMELVTCPGDPTAGAERRSIPQPGECSLPCSRIALIVFDQASDRFGDQLRDRIDGPLTRGLRRITHYRTADALLSRGAFQKRGKPGQTSSPVGQKLHDHATQFAELVVEHAARGVFSIARAAHIEPIHETVIVEAFPNQFLAPLIHERNLPRIHRDASDRYWECLTASDGLSNLLVTLLPGRRFATSPTDIRDHDERAAVVCALTGLAVAMELAVGVGDPEDGDIFLPPVALWGGSRSGTVPWVEAALRDNVAGLRVANSLATADHSEARVRLHWKYWIQ